MHEVIVGGTENVLTVVRGTAVRLIHISTDTEADSPRPLHAYGRAKAAAETITARHPHCAIVRPSLIYDIYEIDHSNREMAKRLRGGETIRLFTNELRCPVWLQTLSAACGELADSDFREIMHIGGGEAVSRAEYAKLLLGWWKVDWEGRVSEVVSDHPERPLDCRLDISRALGLFAVPLLWVREVVAGT